MKYPAYSKYKDSGVQWLGEVPEHWRHVSLKWISHRYTGGTPDKSNEAYWENGSIPWLNSGSVNDRYITEASSYITKEGFVNSSAKWIPKVALVVALAGQGKTKGMVAQLGISSTCNQSMAAIIPLHKVVPRYLYWWLVSNYQNIRNLAGGAQRDGLNLEMLGSIPCPLLPLTEQTAIAKFLDQTTGKIDTLVAKKRALVGLLKEKRTALISRTVTRGLPAEVAREFGLELHTRFKDSGIEWLGEIPKGWERMLVKRITESIISGPFGSSLTKDKYSDSGYRVYGQEQVIPGDFTVGDYYIPNEYFLEMKRYKVSPGDVLVSCVGTFGKVAIVPENIEPGIINPRLILIRPNLQLVLPEYLEVFIRSHFAHGQLQASSRGGTMDIINIGLLGQLNIPLPSLQEQTPIVAYLDRETTQIDNIIEKVEAVIDRLQEYRTALITAAVTGKIDVREAAA